MKTQRFPTIVSLFSLVLLLFIAARPSPETFEKISVREFELIDQHGKERASIRLESTGEIVFRLRDAKGTIRVKMGAGENGSGFVLLDDATNAGFHAVSNETGTKLTLTGKDGKKREY